MLPLARSAIGMQRFPAHLWQLQEVELDLSHRKFVYQGEPLSVRKTLEASKALPAWPKAGNAAVRDVTNFVEDALLEELAPSWPLREASLGVAGQSS